MRASNLTEKRRVKQSSAENRAAVSESCSRMAGSGKFTNKYGWPRCSKLSWHDYSMRIACLTTPQTSRPVSAEISIFMKRGFSASSTMPPPTMQ